MYFVFDIEVLYRGVYLAVNMQKLYSVCSMEIFGNFPTVTTWVSLYLPSCRLILLYVDEVLEKLVVLDVNMSQEDPGIHVKWMRWPLFVTGEG